MTSKIDKGKLCWVINTHNFIEVVASSIEVVASWFVGRHNNWGMEPVVADIFIFAWCFWLAAYRLRVVIEQVSPFVQSLQKGFIFLLGAVFLLSQFLNMETYSQLSRNICSRGGHLCFLGFADLLDVACCST